MPDEKRDGATKGEILLLATEKQAYAFDLAETFRVAIGRHESNDIQLHARNVSNHHVEILNEADGVVVHDLSSTNGTYLNDEKVRQCQLTSGDRIGVGSHVLTVHLKPRKIAWEGANRLYRDGTFEVGARGHLLALKTGSEQGRKTHPSNNPRDLAVSDLLKILSTNTLSTTLVVRRASEEVRIFVDNGRVMHAEGGNAKAEKALYRVFGWDNATYELMELPTSSSVPHTVALPVDTLIMEGIQQAEEVEKLIALLPPPDAPLRLKEDCPLPLAALSPAEIEIYQSLIRHETVDRVLEESPVTDFRIVTLIQSLLRKGVFEIAQSSDGLFEGTNVSLPQAQQRK